MVQPSGLSAMHQSSGFSSTADTRRMRVLYANARDQRIATLDFPSLPILSRVRRIALFGLRAVATTADLMVEPSLFFAGRPI